MAIPTQPPSDGYGAALLGPVRLVVDARLSGVTCIAADAGGQRTALVWPNGWYSLPQSPEPIVNKAGQVVAHANEIVNLGGGFSPGPWPQLEGCPDYDGRVFWVGDVTLEGAN